MKEDRTQYIIAYTQVNYFIHHLPEQYLSKLPKNLVDFIQAQSSDVYAFNIDSSKNLLMQNYSEKAKALIAVLKYNYWSSDAEKRELKIILENNENTYSQQQSVYTNSYLFKNYDSSSFANDSELAMSVSNSTSFLVYLKRFLLKIFKKRS